MIRHQEESIRVLMLDGSSETTEKIRNAIQTWWPNAELVCTNSFKEGLSRVGQVSLDIIILCLGFSSKFGIVNLVQIRSCSQAPILLVLQSKRNETEIAKAIELGADGYMAEPFGELQFIAYIGALLKRRRYVA